MINISAMARAIRAMVVRGKLTLSTMGTIRTMIQVSLLAGELKNNVELLLPYGMSALPMQGDALLVAVAALRDHLVAVMVDDPSLRIPDLKLGEFGFRDARGTQIVFRLNQLEVTSPLPVAITAPQVTFSGNVNIAGTLTCPQINP